MSLGLILRRPRSGRLEGRGARSAREQCICVAMRGQQRSRGRSRRFRLTEIRKYRMCRSPRPKDRGVSRSSRCAGRVAVGVERIGAHAIAGRVWPVSGCAARTRPVRFQRTAKACGPDARGLCVKACGDVAARPGARISHLQGAGAIVHRSPGRARHKPSNHCAGKAGMSRLPCMPLCICLRAICAQRTAGASRRPVFPAPFPTKGRREKQGSGVMRREAVLACPVA